MIHAYAETYLNDAMQNLGEAFDYAVNSCKISGDDFFSLFVATGFSEMFGNGNPKIVAGRSGTELVMEVLQKAGFKRNFPKPRIEYESSSEFWCGWILAYYQWRTTKSFKDINRNLPFDEILKLYPTLHEASEEKFVDVANTIINKKIKTTKLQTQRKIRRLSQKQLSELSGVNLRTLQQYEIGTKDLNKASVQTVLMLAKVLSCRLEDLLQ